MVNFYLAYTQAVNPDGVSPVLTKPQLWAGLQRKVRNAPEFVPVIVSCEVLKEEGNIVTRQVLFKEGSGQQHETPVKEVCKEYKPTKVGRHTRARIHITRFEFVTNEDLLKWGIMEELLLTWGFFNSGLRSTFTKKMARSSRTSSLMGQEVPTRICT